MEFKSLENVSMDVKTQIQKVVDIWKCHLCDDLTGVYLHGSIVLNNFCESNDNEVKSDIDILIVSGRKIERNERLSIARKIIGIDRTPSPLEMSTVWMNDLVPWKFPTPCQFHYSDSWTEQYIKMLYGEIRSDPIIDDDFTDEDIASYVHLINQCGVCIYGKPIHIVFPPVPEQDFWKSISADVNEYDFHAYNPRYFTSNILVLGRILSYKHEKRILSKYDGALWAMNYVPEKFKYIIDTAIKTWYSGEKSIDYDKKDLEGLRRFLIDEILR